jgi:4-hydroxybenzoate polyprenyltransferase
MTSDFDTIKEQIDTGAEEERGVKRGNIMSGSKIAGIIVIVVIVLFVAVGPTALQFRALLELVFNFVAIIAWPLATVLIVLILRRPLSDLVNRVGQVHGPAAGPSQAPSETASKPD